jgi:hypothetical protein
MKIYFERSGGFVGRNVSAVVDTSQLPPEQALGLLTKVEEASFFDLPESPGAALEGYQGVDQLCYKVTVEVAGVQHTVETSDANAPQELQPLLDELSQLARASTRPTGQTTTDRSGYRR